MSGSAIDAVVLDANRGRVVVDVGLRRFIPLSQLVSVGAIDVRQHGVVVGVTSYGLFVDVDVDVGVGDGLVHCSPVDQTHGRRPVGAVRERT